MTGATFIPSARAAPGSQSSSRSRSCSVGCWQLKAAGEWLRGERR